MGLACDTTLTPDLFCGRNLVMDYEAQNEEAAQMILYRLAARLDACCKHAPPVEDARYRPYLDRVMKEMVSTVAFAREHSNY